MLKRALFVAAAAAVLVPLAAAPAQASCLDDALAGLSEGYYENPKSEYWGLDHVQHSGTANVTIHGDAAISDWTLRVDDFVRLAEAYVANAPEVTTEFVDCVAG